MRPDPGRTIPRRNSSGVSAALVPGSSGPARKFWRGAATVFLRCCSFGQAGLLVTVEVAGGFRHRTRPQGPAETARKAVTKALRAQMGRLLEEHPAIGRHLRDAVRMGTVCVYAPAAPVVWNT